MKVYFSKYQMDSSVALNRYGSESQHREGALIKVELPSGLFGVADLCPLVEWGDHPVDTHLQRAARGEPTDLFQRAQDLALRDAESCRENRSLLVERAQQITNHFLITDLEKVSPESLKAVARDKFATIKVKMGRHVQRESEFLKPLVAAHDFKWRLDFNFAMARSDFEQWLDDVKSWLLPKLDFIESPFRYDPRTWQSVSQAFGVRLGLDISEHLSLSRGRLAIFKPPSAVEQSSLAHGYSVLILKPMRFDVFSLLKEEELRATEVVVTHCFDHWVGQKWAWIVATELIDKGLKVAECGLLPGPIAGPHQSDGQLEFKGPHLTGFASGPGIGGHTVLEDGDWTPLKKPSL